MRDICGVYLETTRGAIVLATIYCHIRHHCLSTFYTCMCSVMTYKKIHQKTMEKGSEGKEGKGREGKGREGKGREGKGREGRGGEDIPRG